MRIVDGSPQVIPSPNNSEHQHDLSLDNVIPYQNAGPSGLFEREYIEVDCDYHHQESLDEILFQMVEHAKILSLSLQQQPEMDQGQGASLAIVASGGNFIGESLSSDMEFTSVSVLGSDLLAGQSGQGGPSDGSSTRTCRLLGSRYGRRIEGRGYRRAGVRGLLLFRLIAVDFSEGRVYAHRRERSYYIIMIGFLCMLAFK